MSQQNYLDGVLRERWDDVQRTYTEFDAAGEVVSSRPYTVEENARADAEAAAVVADSNRVSIETALDDTLAELQTLVDTPNATINSGPAPYIKVLARALRRLIRLVLRRFDGTT